MPRCHLKDPSQSGPNYPFKPFSPLFLQVVATMTSTVLSPNRLFRSPGIFLSPLRDLLEDSCLHPFKDCLRNVRHVRQPAGPWTQLKGLQRSFFDQLLPLPLPQPPLIVLCLPAPPRSRFSLITTQLRGSFTGASPTPSPKPEGGFSFISSKPATS